MSNGVSGAIGKLPVDALSLIRRLAICENLSGEILQIQNLTKKGKCNEIELLKDQKSVIEQQNAKLAKLESALERLEASTHQELTTS